MKHETFAALVQRILDARGETLGSLAAAAGMSPSGLRRLCRGQIAVPRSPTVAGLAKALGVAPAKVRAAIEASRKLAGR